MHGDFTEAARRMFVSQPSVTAAMRDLEREASISVFERTIEGMVAAMEGQTFPGYTRQAIEQADLPQDQAHEAIEDVADRPAPQNGHRHLLEQASRTEMRCGSELNLAPAPNLRPGRPVCAAPAMWAMRSTPTLDPVRYPATASSSPPAAGTPASSEVRPDAEPSALTGAVNREQKRPSHAIPPTLPIRFKKSLCIPERKHFVNWGFVS